MSIDQMEKIPGALPWQWTPKKRQRDVMDVFFEEGDRFCHFSSKQILLDTDEAEDINRLPEFPCSLSGCSELFDTIIGYESHYNSVHRHTCTGCRRTFPSNFLLELHLQESHDPLFQLRTGDKFLCLVQGCEGRFVSAKSRRNHMIKIHKYPASYRFERKNKTSTCTSDRTSTSRPETGQQSSEMDMSEKENIPQGRAVQHVYSYKVPQSICFGHGSSRGFQRPSRKKKDRHWHQTKMDVDTAVDIEQVNMGDLEDALTNQ